MKLFQEKMIESFTPPLKWAGGKRWLVPYVRNIWYKYNTYRMIEPFAGGLAVSLSILPDSCLINDVNVHLMNFYNKLREGLIIDIDMKNEKDVYYKNRDRFNYLISENRIYSQESASLFYYLNRTGFNGLCRFNKKGYFNVPFGKYKKINYTYDFMKYKKVFQGWDMYNTDFTNLKIRDGDFIYADPPYDVEFTSYSPGGFTWSDQVRFIEWVSTYQGPILISNQSTIRIRDLYHNHGFELLELDAPRQISSDGNRSKTKEILAYRGIDLEQMFFL